MRVAVMLQRFSTTVTGTEAMDQQSIIVRLGADRITFFSGISNSEGKMVGARLSAGDLCPGCRQLIGTDHVVGAQFEPGCTGVFGHVNCDDPMLAAETEQL